MNLRERQFPSICSTIGLQKKLMPRNLIVREKRLYREITQNIRGSRTATLDLLVDLQSSARDYTRISDYVMARASAYDQTFASNLNHLTNCFVSANVILSF